MSVQLDLLLVGIRQRQAVTDGVEGDLRNLSVCSQSHKNKATRVGIIVIEFHDESVARICVFSYLCSFCDDFEVERRTAVWNRFQAVLLENKITNRT